MRLMKTVVRLVGIAVILFLVFSVLSYLAIRQVAKDFIIDKLRQQGINITMEALDISPGFNITAKGVKIQDAAYIDRVTITPLLTSSILNKRLKIQEVALYNPKVIIVKAREAGVDNLAAGILFSSVMQDKKKQIDFSVAEKKVKSEEVSAAFKEVAFISELNIYNGEISFKDIAVPNQFDLTIKSVDAKIQNISLPLQLSNKIDIDLTGTIPWRSSLYTGNLDISGWYSPKTLSLNTDIMLDNIDLLHFQPYLPKFLMLNLQETVLGLFTKLEAKNNILNISADIGVLKLVIKDRTQQEAISQQQSFSQGFISPAVLSVLKQSYERKEKIHIEYVTKLTNPEFDWKQIVNSLINKYSINVITDVVLPKVFELTGDQPARTGAQPASKEDKTKQAIDMFLGILSEFTNESDSDSQQQQPVQRQPITE